MADWFYAALLAGGVTWGLLFWLLRLDGALPLDHPNARSLHAVPVPRIGGVGIAAGLGTVTWVLGDAGLGLILVLALALAALSWLDDWRGLPVLLRLPLHLAAAVALVFSAGISGFTALALMLAVVWMVNLYNFMDGSDGLAGGMAISGFGCYAVAAWLEGDLEIARQATAVAAAALGFLWFNRPPARLFLGDVGAIPLGFLAAALGLEGWRRGLWPAFFPAVAFAPFIVDASVTLAQRLARGERIWLAHRDHYYQRLARLGWSKGRLLAVAYPLMAISAASALIMVWLPDWSVAAGLVCGGSLFTAGWWVDRLWRRRGAP